MAIVFFALFWITVRLSSPWFMAEPEIPKIPPLDVVLRSSAELIGISVAISLILVWTGSSWSELGLSTKQWREKVWTGVRGFFAAVIPMAISIAITAPLRRESRHPLLTLLGDSPDWRIVLCIFLAAVIAAPIWEELLFRVILQGWLTTLLPPISAVATVAVLFSLIHGLWNGIALLPLSLILGYVFHRTHSYLSVVVIHMLFNATMLALQLLNPPALE